MKAAYRLFIAVEIPGPAARELASWQAGYLAADKALRLSPPGQLHITLIFLGPAGEKEKELAAGELDRLGERQSFDITITGLVGLPRKRPHVIAAACEESTGGLKAIHDDLAAGLVSAKLYKREKRLYFPHVTIARARGRPRAGLAEIHPEPVKFTAVRVTLYNSILKPGGAVHEALKSVQLI